MLRNVVMSRSDAGSTSNAPVAVGAPSETRKWQHYHDFLDEQASCEQQQENKSVQLLRHEVQDLSLEHAVKHLDKCEEAQQQVDGLSALMDQSWSDHFTILGRRVCDNGRSP